MSGAATYPDGYGPGYVDARCHVCPARFDSVGTLREHLEEEHSEKEEGLPKEAAPEVAQTGYIYRVSHSGLNPVVHSVDESSSPASISKCGVEGLSLHRVPREVTCKKCLKVSREGGGVMTTPVQTARHTCGMCDGLLRFDHMDGPVPSWTCEACGAWHTAKDCCEEGHT